MKTFKATITLKIIVRQYAEVELNANSAKEAEERAIAMFLGHELAVDEEVCDDDDFYIQVKEVEND